jgi:hypothetical protein
VDRCPRRHHGQARRPSRPLDASRALLRQSAAHKRRTVVLRSNSRGGGRLRGMLPSEPDERKEKPSRRAALLSGTLAARGDSSRLTAAPAALNWHGSANARGGVLGRRSCDLAVDGGAADGEQLRELSNRMLSGPVEFEQDRALGGAELWCFAFESAFGAGDRHSFAGAHPQQVDLELGERRKDMLKKHLPIGSLGS